MAQHRVSRAPVTWTLPATRSQKSGIRVGVLAVQGDFLEHQIILDSLGAETVPVRLPRDLEGLQALVLPGGESTTMVKLVDAFDLREPLKECIASGTPVWGTCAGLILLARELREDRPEPLGVMDIRVSRNAYGRQVDSFETDISVPPLGEPPFHAVFIPGPRHPGDGARRGGAGESPGGRSGGGAPGDGHGHRLPPRADARHPVSRLLPPDGNRAGVSPTP